MQRTVTSCDACGAIVVSTTHCIATLLGDGAAVMRKAIPGGGNKLDLCGDCTTSMAAWLADRAPAKPVTPAPAPTSSTTTASGSTTLHA